MARFPGIPVEEVPRAGGRFGGIPVEQAAPQATPPPPHQSSRQRMRQTLEGNAQRTPVAPRSLGEIGQSYLDVGKGVAVGAPSAALGIPGDIESVARLGLSKAAPVSRETAIPTTTQIGNMIAGEPANKEEAAGRTIGGFAGPSLAVRGATLAARGGGTVLSHALGTATGTGGRAIQEAYRAGRTGGQAGQAFRDQMRGNAAADEVVSTARDAVESLRKTRSDQYKQGIGSTIRGDATVLNFAPIDAAIRSASGIGQFKGKVTIGGADKVWKKIEEVVDDWRTSDPAQFHTPEGLDALKQRINNLVHDEELKVVAGPGTPGSKIVSAVHRAIGQQISAQAPGYARVMKDYSTASETLRELETGLSLKHNATVDSSLRKLQSILRNNANTNYGQRVKMGELLDRQSGGTLMPKLAGQAMSSATPRGIQGPLAGAGGLLALTTNPAALPLLAATSPRLVGEAAHLAGRASGSARNTLLPRPGTPRVAASAAPHIARVLAELPPDQLSRLLPLIGVAP